MTEPDASATNYAGDHAHVDVQVGTVHGGVHYYTLPAGAPPEERFKIGVHLLDGGMAGKARQLMHEAVVDGHGGNEACFHLQLALVSGRTRQEMPPDDTRMLRYAPRKCRVSGGDAWADGVKTIGRLLDAAWLPDADLRPLLKDLDGLGEPQRTMILRHMELFLEGPLQDAMWKRSLESAEQNQMVNDRADRVWKFFEPKPLGPRVREPRPPDAPMSSWLQAVSATTALFAAAVYIGYLLARELQVLAVLLYLLSIGGGYFAARGGLEWRFRVERRRAKDAEYAPPRARPASAPSGGFASKVDQRFDHYFARYVPRNASRSAWLDGTAGIRRTLRDEIVDVYREERTGVERIAWLIRYHVGEVRKRWEHGTLWDYRRELAVPPSTKVVTLLGLAACLLGACQAMVAATQVAPVGATRSTAIALAAGFVAARAWLRIVLERKRHAADEAERAQTLAACEAAFQRWQRKLADKPSDLEMAAWLDCDRKLLLDEALRHYGLSMSDLIAHAFIEAPGIPTRRARVRHGPWRYTRYQLLLFLLTTDGIRQFKADLDFTQGTFRGHERTNYRYEAVAAVRVHQAERDERKFELALINGAQIEVEVLASGTEELLVDEPPGVVAEVTLDSAGLNHTLHVLEGVAAEGKRWITQERRRKTDRVRPLPR
ncbi:hypothetical protein ACIBI3_00825 [Actinomadura luteofluorescens]|uniref:hypothetical protein n=1 Tax=Actinomadura luteofluorescens TaxID=46163 RepID=UPI00347967CA